MTEPISDEELDPCENFPEDSKWTCLNADAFHDTCRPCAIRLRISLERKRADEAVRKCELWESEWRQITTTAAYIKAGRDAAEAECERLRAVVEAAEPDLAAAYSLINGSSLPMDMQPMRARVLRTLDRVRALAAPPDPKEGT